MSLLLCVIILLLVADVGESTQSPRLPIAITRKITVTQKHGLIRQHAMFMVHDDVDRVFFI